MNILIIHNLPQFKIQSTLNGIKRFKINITPVITHSVNSSTKAIVDKLYQIDLIIL